MPKNKTLPALYVKAMKDIGRGHGFYNPASPEVMRPGMCGYIDSLGTWRPIVDLTSKDDIEGGGYHPPSYLVKSKQRKIDTLNVTSEGVQATSVGGGGGGGAMGIQGALTFTLDNSTSFGAALVATTEVFEDGFEYENDLKKWAKRNRKILLQNRSEVRQYGFYVVQTTWTTQDVYINAWTKKTKSVTLNLQVNVAQAGEAQVTASQTQESAVDGGWIHPLPMDDEVPEDHVIFFKGVRYRYLLASEALPWIAQTRGHEDSESDDDVPSPIDDPADPEPVYLVPWESDDDEASDDDDEEGEGKRND